MKRKLIVDIVSILYMSLMLYAAVSKLTDYNLSREQMAMMPALLPISHILVWMLPAVEILIALLIYLPRTRKSGLYAVTALMMGFTIYIVYMMLNYSHLPCSCGGLMEALSWKGHLVFNSLFILLGFIAIRRLNSSAKSQRSYSLI